MGISAPWNTLTRISIVLSQTCAIFKGRNWMNDYSNAWFCFVIIPIHIFFLIHIYFYLGKITTNLRNTFWSVFGTGIWNSAKNLIYLEIYFALNSNVAALYLFKYPFLLSFSFCSFFFSFFFLLFSFVILYIYFRFRLPPPVPLTFAWSANAQSVCNADLILYNNNHHHNNNNASAVWIYLYMK